MKKKISLVLILVFLLEFTVFAGLGSNDVAYIGGSIAAFTGRKEVVEGKVVYDEGDFLRLYYEKRKEHFDIPYANVLDIEYGQKAAGA